MINSLRNNLPQRVVELKYQLEKQNELLRAINPSNVLNRGYSYLIDENKKVIAGVENFKKLKTKDKIYAHFKDGVGEMEKI